MKDSKEVKTLVVNCGHCELAMEKTDDGYACRTIGCGKDEDGNVSITTG